MALKHVKAKIGGKWTELTYNEATGHYEGTLPIPKKARSRPLSTIPVMVKAINEAGEKTMATAHWR